MTVVELSGRVHDLKCWPGSFEAIVDGRKPFEVRLNDRDYQVGDVLALREWDPSAGSYTGRGERAVVTYVYQGDDPTMPLWISGARQDESESSMGPVVVLGLSLGGIEV